jgi:capsular exopolysaccharide synthesis family protein
MSRIYEALERAEKERGRESESEQQPGVGATITNLDEGKASVTANRFFESITRHVWSPSVISLPTLAESGLAVEQFRSLRSSIYQMRDQISLKTIIVSSGMPAEGKTFVAANLAMSLGRNNEQPVLLIDADLRRPSIHHLLGTRVTPGLTQYLAGEAELSDILQRGSCPEIANAPGAHAISNVALIPAGESSDSSPELAGNRRIDELVGAVSPHFAWIIIDSPPVLAVTDAADLARVAEGVLLVARGATTKIEVAQRAQAAFTNSRILGFVLNAVRGVPRNGYYYYYYGGERSGNSTTRRKTNRGRA